MKQTLQQLKNNWIDAHQMKKTIRFIVCQMKRTIRLMQSIKLKEQLEQQRIK